MGSNRLDYNRDYPDGMSAVNDPAKLLLPDPVKTDDWRKGVTIPVVAAVFCSAVPLFKSISAKVPLYTGIYRYPIAAGIGFVLGKLFEDWRYNLAGMRDTNYQNYIERHIDDFQPLERKKVGELFKPWVPIR